MPTTLEKAMAVAVSARALFNLESENELFDPLDDSAYMALQMQKLDEIAAEGAAFHLVRKLLALNGNAGTAGRRVEIVILSRNDPVSGLRVFKSAQARGLDIERGFFTRGRPPFGYLRPLGAKLFLSANPADVRSAIEAGLPAASIFPRTAGADPHPDEIRIAFDGDGVLFDDGSEQVFQQGGIAAFVDHEQRNAGIPLSPGPLWPLLAALHGLRAMQSSTAPMRLRLGLFTARSAPAHERAIRTLMTGGVEIDEAAFLGGLDKGPFLAEFQPDIFFDDQSGHIASASRVTSVGHVPFGITNRLR